MDVDILARNAKDFLIELLKRRKETFGGPSTKDVESLVEAAWHMAYMFEAKRK